MLFRSIKSFGFVKFRVNLFPKLPKGTRILNRVGISYNYGSFATTNQTFHTVGQDFIITATIDRNELVDTKVVVYPNPFSDRATFDIQSAPLSKTSTFSLYDMMGRQVRSEYFEGNQFEFERNNLPNGMYVFKIENEGRRIATGKLVVKN